MKITNLILWFFIGFELLYVHETEQICSNRRIFEEEERLPLLAQQEIPEQKGGKKLRNIGILSKQNNPY